MARNNFRITGGKRTRRKMGKRNTKSKTGKRKTGKKAPTAWSIHVKKVYTDMKKENPDVLLKDALKAAAKTYVKP
jgi:hypothetical protein